MGRSKHYQLGHEEFLRIRQLLKPAELDIYLYLATKHPFSDSVIEIDTAEISEQLGHHRRTVQLAVKKLSSLQLIEIEITKFKYRTAKYGSNSKYGYNESTNSPQTSLQTHLNESTNSPQTSLQTHLNESTDRHDESTDRYNESTDSPQTSLQTHLNESTDRQRPPEPPPRKDSEPPQTIQTIQTIQTLSEDEREKFFSFVQEKTKGFNPQINDLQGWLAAKNQAGLLRCQVYWELYQRENNTTKSNDWRNHPEWPQALKIMTETGHGTFVVQGGDGITLNREERLRLMRFAREHGYLNGGNEQ